MGVASNSNRVSRPFRKLRTSPTLSRIWRCLVTACLVRLVPSASCEIDWRETRQSLAISDSRVSSPKAAKMCAWRKNPWGKTLSNILGNVLHLFDPALLVHAEGLEPPVSGDLFKSRFGHHEVGPAAGRFQRELDQGRGLFGVVDRGIDGVRVPGE